MLHTDIEKVLISREAIQKRIQELGRKISADYAGKCPVFIGVLKGCIVFLSDILKHVDIKCSVDFICLSSYSGAKSTGVVRTLLDLRESIQGRDVIVVEDIVDSGLTLGYLLDNLRTRKPRSLEVCTLLDKPACRKSVIPIKYRGFRVPNQFVVGYGLDYNEIYRNLPYVGVIKKSLVHPPARKSRTAAEKKKDK